MGAVRCRPREDDGARAQERLVTLKYVVAECALDGGPHPARAARATRSRGRAQADERAERIRTHQQRTHEEASERARAHR